MKINPTEVTLREIRSDSVRAVIKLAVTEYQNRFVAPNAVSLAQALFAPEAWYRAVYLAEDPVGFVMLSDQSLLDPVPDNPELFVWRFMIDANYQHMGIGRAALRLVIEHARSKGNFDELKLSYVPAEGGPEPLYLSLGFLPTGDVEDGEVIMSLRLNDRAA
jgi:diamine N-acetyltransferase